VRHHRHRRFGPHARFNLAVLLTIVVVAYVVVPAVLRFASAMGGWDPQYYEPKDFSRTDWLADRRGQIRLPDFSWDAVVNVLLFLLVGAVWLFATPWGRRR
jgi:hypothetical protein